jgi:hypothetical protein
MAYTWAPLATIAKDVQAGVVTASELVDRALGVIANKSDYQLLLRLTKELNNELQLLMLGLLPANK